MTTVGQVTTSEFVINRIFADDASFLMESILAPWGADDNVVEAIVDGSYTDRSTIKLWSLLASRTRAGEVVADVGAYTGIFSLIAAKSSWLCKIVAFEPSAVTFGRLVKNITLNGAASRVVPCNLAITAQETILSMPHKWGHYTLCSGEAFDAEDSDHTQPAFCIPLDRMLSPAPSTHYLNSRSNSIWPFTRVAAIKIDVEGAEPGVLEGARQLIARDQPVILAEALSHEAEAALVEFAQSMSYDCRRIAEEWNFALFPAGDEQALALLEKAIAAPSKLRGVRQLRFGL